MAQTIDLKKWFFATENYNDDFHADIVLLRVAVSLFSRTKHDEILAAYEGTHSRFYMVREESKRVSEELIGRFMTDREWRRNLYPRILKAAAKLEDLYDHFLPMGGAGVNPSVEEVHPSAGDLLVGALGTEDLRVEEVGTEDLRVEALGTEDLLRLYREQNRLWRELLLVAWPIEEMHSDMNSIENRLMALVGGDKEVYADLLYTPELSAFSEEKKRLCAGEDPEKVWRKFRFNGYHGYTNPRIKSLEEYKAEAAGMTFEADTEAEERYRKASKNLPEETLDIFRCYANLGVAKSYRRLAELKNFYYLDHMIREFSGRFGVPEEAIRFMTPEEIQRLPEQFQSYQAYDPDRCNSMVYYRKGDQEEILTGEASRELMEALKKVEKASFTPETSETVDTIKGLIACRGTVKGRAVVIRTAEDTKIFQPGDVLVSNEPNPEQFELMRTASAVVTDQGGITCHAASIARELGIPCITGTRNATERIRTGDMVFVDACTGEVTVEPREES